MSLMRGFLCILVALVSAQFGFGATSLARGEKKSGHTAAVSALGAVKIDARSMLAGTMSAGLTSRNLMKLAVGMGIDDPAVNAALLEVVPKHILATKTSDLLAAARTLGVGQNALDLTHDAHDIRPAVIELITKTLRESEEENENENDDFEDGLADESEENDGFEENEDSEESDDFEETGRRRRRKSRITRRRQGWFR